MVPKGVQAAEMKGSFQFGHESNSLKYNQLCSAAIAFRRPRDASAIGAGPIGRAWGMIPAVQGSSSLGIQALGIGGPRPQHIVLWVG